MIVLFKGWEGWCDRLQVLTHLINYCLKYDAKLCVDWEDMVWGGDEFVFFRPVFNVADASISVSVILMILFQKRIFNLENIQESNESQPENKEEPTPSEEA
jgi:lipoprotein signal peptidase